MFDNFDAYMSVVLNKPAVCGALAVGLMLLLVILVSVALVEGKE